MKTFFKNNPLIVITILAFILTTVIYLTFYFVNKKPNQPPFIKPNTGAIITTAPITEKHQKPKVLFIKNVPTLTPDKGQGIDITSQIARNSIGSIKSISKALPYEKNIRTSNGIDVTIIIPPPQIQDNPWSLTVYLHGIDFNVPKDSDDYDKMKAAYLESVSLLMAWINNQGATSGQIIYNWGDKEYMHKRAEEWLQ